MLDVENTVTQMKRAFDGLVGRMDVVEKRYSEVEDRSIESSKTKSKE